MPGQREPGAGTPGMSGIVRGERRPRPGAPENDPNPSRDAGGSDDLIPRGG